MRFLHQQAVMSACDSAPDAEIRRRRTQVLAARASLPLPSCLTWDPFDSVPHMLVQICNLAARDDAASLIKCLRAKESQGDDSDSRVALPFLTFAHMPA